MIQQIKRFLQLESASGILLLAFATLAMIFANSPLKEFYFDFLSMPVSIQVGLFSIHKPLLMWVNDGFMAVFFVLVGLEVKREMLVGRFRVINKPSSLLSAHSVAWLSLPLCSY